jgi:hypothetical protein
MPIIVRRNAPKVGVDWENLKGEIKCDKCGKYYAEIFDEDDQINICIWCNLDWHNPIGKRNHKRFPIDGRKGLEHFTTFAKPPEETEKSPAETAPGKPLIDCGDLIMYHLGGGKWYPGFNASETEATDFCDHTQEVFRPAQQRRITPGEMRSELTRLQDQLAKIESLLDLETAKPAVDAAFARIDEVCGTDGPIKYDDSKEGMVLVHTLLESAGIASESPQFANMAANWRAACSAADQNGDGTVSRDQAAEIWLRIVNVSGGVIGGQLESLREVIGTLDSNLPDDTEVKIEGSFFVYCGPLQK